MDTITSHIHVNLTASSLPSLQRYHFQRKSSPKITPQQRGQLPPI